MLDIITNTYKVKYIILDKLYRSGYVGDKEVNVFINLESILNKMARANVMNYLKTTRRNNSIEFISSIINLAGHYKWYFIKKGYRTKVFLYMNYPFRCMGLNNRNILHDYKHTYEYRYDKNVEYHQLSRVINDSIPYLESIVQYIQDVYYIRDDKVESSVIPYIISEDKDTHNIIVSSDVYDTQYRSFGFDIIFPKRDDTILFGRDSIIDQIPETSSVEYLNSLSPEMITFLIALTGSTTKAIKSIKGIGIKTALKMIRMGIEKGYISDKVSSPHMLASIIKEEVRDQFTRNYYCTSISTQANFVSSVTRYEILEQIIDRFDNESLKKINDNVFSKFPLNLIELTAIPKKKVRVYF